MDNFALIHGDMFTEEDPSYIPLSQFDLELEHQAQTALQQQQQQHQHQQQLQQAQSLDFQPFMFMECFSQNLNASMPFQLSQPASQQFNYPSSSPEKLQHTPVVYSQLPPTPTDLQPGSVPIAQEPPSQQRSLQPTSMPILTIPEDPAEDPLTTTASDSTTPMPNLFPGMMTWNSDVSTKKEPATIDWSAIEKTSPNQPPKKTSPPLSTSTPTDDSGNSQPPTICRTPKKTAHNAIERRYRNNINDRITELKNAVPALTHAKPKDSRTGKRSLRASMDDDDDDGEDTEEYLDGVAIATKLNKATILRKATEYIAHLKHIGDDLRHENAMLQHLLAQLPGGHEMLSLYSLQRAKREQELQRQQILERKRQKEHQQQSLKATGRKRSRHPSTEHEEDESSSSSSMTGPATPPAIANRVFMAIFMCLTFFSTSPLTGGPNAPEHAQGHHHASRMAGISTEKGSNPAVTPRISLGPSILGIPIVGNGWAILRTVVFAVCLVQLCLPFIMSHAFRFKVKRIPVTKRAMHRRVTPTTKKNRSTATQAFSGDEQCIHIYNILVKSLALAEDAPPQGTLATLWPLCKESVRLLSRHWLGYDILYEGDPQRDLEDEWQQVCRWIKLNEIECLGGNPNATQISMLYNCFRMINLVESLDDKDHSHVGQSRARAYATAAMQMELLIPKQFLSASSPCLATSVSQYFWRLAMYEVEEEEDDTHNAFWTRWLTWGEPMTVIKSRAWAETLDVVRNQTSLRHDQPTELSLSWSAPVLVPASLLASMHLLDSLRSQFRLLLESLVNPSRTVARPLFAPLFALTAPHSLGVDDHDMKHTQINELRSGKEQQVVHWFASVGAAVEDLWRQDGNADQSTGFVSACVPQALTSAVVSSNPTEQDLYRSRIDKIDGWMKESFVHVLHGAACLQRGDDKQGMEQLQQAEQLRGSIKKLQKSTYGQDQYQSVESEVMVLCECAVAMVGLEAWIQCWKVRGGNEEIREQVRQATLALRRMVRRPSLDWLRGNQSFIERLSRLGRAASCELDEIDSACDCSDLEDSTVTDDSSPLLPHQSMSEQELLKRRANKALDLLHGR